MKMRDAILAAVFNEFVARFPGIVIWPKSGPTHKIKDFVIRAKTNAYNFIDFEILFIRRR